MAETATATKVNDDGPDFDSLEDDIESIIQSAKPIGEKTGEHRAKIKQLLNDRGFEKGAFAALVKIGRMSEDKRNDYLATLIPGLKIMCPIWQEGETGDLFGDRPQDPDNLTQLHPPAAAE